MDRQINKDKCNAKLKGSGQSYLVLKAQSVTGKKDQEKHLSSQGEKKTSVRSSDREKARARRGCNLLSITLTAKDQRPKSTKRPDYF